jgi:hypothetical protein
MNLDTKLALLTGAAVLLLFCTTLLLDWPWIAAHLIRQILVYALMALEAWVFYKNVIAVAKAK